MTQRKCWGQPVIYSCAEAEFSDPRGDMRTRFALDDRLNNDFVVGAGHIEGLALRPFAFRVATHSDYGMGPSHDPVTTQTPRIGIRVKARTAVGTVANALFA